MIDMTTEDIISIGFPLLDVWVQSQCLYKRSLLSSVGGLLSEK